MTNKLIVRYVALFALIVSVSPLSKDAEISKLSDQIQPALDSCPNTTTPCGTNCCNPTEVCVELPNNTACCPQGQSKYCLPGDGDAFYGDCFDPTTQKCCNTYYFGQACGLAQKCCEASCCKLTDTCHTTTSGEPLCCNEETPDACLPEDGQYGPCYNAKQNKCCAVYYETALCGLNDTCCIGFDNTENHVICVPPDRVCCETYDGYLPYSCPAGKACCGIYACSSRQLCYDPVTECCMNSSFYDCTICTKGSTGCTC